MDISGLNRLLGPIRRRLALMVGRGVVALVNDALRLQGVQVALLADETRDNVERFQQYGFTSHPHAGAEAVVLSLGGARNHLVAIAVDDRRYRIQALQAGEVALYTDEDADAPGHRIVLKRGGVIELRCARLDVRAEDELRLDGDVVKIHARSVLQYDCAGHGQQWFLDHVDPWVIGATPGTTHPITPPEIP